jgi:predicted small secreted protein
LDETAAADMGKEQGVEAVKRVKELAKNVSGVWIVLLKGVVESKEI